ncbi:hypothetical protein ABW19_dt0207934 [Dactylella cylindrospora]|nr:hypothetical protein ABW19_dt0207934 [Dactylella cylindrospora]
MSKRQQNNASNSRIQLQSQPDTSAKADWKVIITTATEVNVWNGTNNKYDTVFASGTEGIVAAKLAREGNVLAVAGSQVVLLHRIEKGQQQSYKLKGSDATRLLEYAADGKSIFLNSSLRNSIQTYNVKDDKITEHLKSHPSPVTCFAASLDSTLILSASANPPTIHLDNLGLRTSTHLKPKASDHKVILSSFHPNRKNIFLIAFSDGVLAAYDYSKASKNGQHIHAFGHLHDAMMGGKGITAAEFVPGSQTKAVTAGEDGRCTLLDFDKKDVIGSFHVGAPVTCLSVRGDDNGKKGSGKWLVAVGTLHGWCYIYDQDGTKLHEVQIDNDGNKVLGVTWRTGDIKLPVKASIARSPRKTSSSLPLPVSRTPQFAKVRPMLPPPIEEPIIAAEKPEAPIQFSAINKPASPIISRMNPISSSKPLPKAPLPKPEEDSWEDVQDEFKEQKPAWEELQHGFTTDYMSIFSPVKNEPLRNSPRRSARLSIRSTNSPVKDGEDRVARLIQQDEDGHLRPSVSSPSLATNKPNSPEKKTTTKEAQETEENLKTAPRLKPKPSKRQLTKPARLDPELETKVVIPEAIQVLDMVPETKPEVPLKGSSKSERPIQRDFAVQQALPPQNPLSLPTTDSKSVSDFRKVREKIESGHSHPVLSLFSSHLPNHKPKPQSDSVDNVDDKENSSGVPTLNKAEAKAEKKRVKMEEKERRKSAREEKKRKKKDSSFPSVSDLVFKDDDMDIDGPPNLRPQPHHHHHHHLHQLELPSIASKLSSGKRKAPDDPYDASSGSGHPKLGIKTSKGKEKAEPPVEGVQEDIWMPDEVRKPSKRVNFGETSGPARGTSQLLPHDGTMSIHDMIADLKATFKEEMSAMKADMKEKFTQQNVFFEQLIENERSESRALRLENQRLKAEIQELLRIGSRK